MIMVSDITLNNYTAPSKPVWMTADNYAALLQQNRSLRDRLTALLGR